MNNKKNILIPIDFTDTSNAGLATAVDIISKTESNLILFNVVEEPHTGSFRADGDISARMASQKEQDRFIIEMVNKRKKQFAKLLSEFDIDSDKAEAMVYVGQFRNVLESIIEQRDDISMMIMGTSGETNATEFLTGNHTTQAIRRLDIPVLSVKEFEPVSSLRKLLLWVDKDNFLSERMTTLSHLTNALNIELGILGVSPNLKESENLKDSLQLFAERNHFENYEIMTIDDGNETEKIAHAIRTGGYDAIATLSNKTSGFMSLFVGDDVEELVNELEVPVYAVTD
jgi:nucleotide-binding universal stress UspA family protein